jgi:hypothetical protein
MIAPTVLLLLVMSSARAADVHIGINIGPPPPPAVVLPAPPELVVVPHSPVYYAPAVPYNFFYYGGVYYVFHDGYWFSSPSTHGPWAFVPRVPRLILAVPAHYYKVPPGHGKKHGPPPWAGRGHGRGHGKHD